MGQGERNRNKTKASINALIRCAQGAKKAVRSNTQTNVGEVGVKEEEGKLE